MHDTSNEQQQLQQLQQLQRLLVLHRYDIYADRRKKRVIYTVSALLCMEEKIQRLQRATTATSNDGNEQPQHERI